MGKSILFFVLSRREKAIGIVERAQDVRKRIQ